MRTFRINRLTILLLALGGLGAALVLLRGSTFGVGLEVDSSLYVAGARNLMSGNGLLGMSGGSYADAPPLFPLALASLGVAFGVDPVDAAGYLNAIAFGLTIFVTTMWLRSRVQSRFLLVWAGCVCALSTPLAAVSATALTEPLFILFTTLSLFALDRFLGTERRWYLFMAAACAALALSTRYAGVPLVAGASLMLLWKGGVKFSARVRNAAIYCVIAAAPIGAWMIRNLLDRAAPLGRHYPTGFSPARSLANTVDEFSRWVFGEIGFGYLDGFLQDVSDAIGGRISGDPFAIHTALKAVVLLGLAAGVVHALGRIRSPRRVGGIAVPAVFISAYAVFSAIVFPITDIRIYWRFLTPVYVPMLAAATLILNEFFRCARERRAVEEPAASCKGNPRAAGMAAWGASTPALAACLSLWLLPQVAANYRDVERWMNDGVTRYSNKAWAESDVIRYLNSHPMDKDGWVLSNDVRAVYLLADHPNRWEVFSQLPARMSAVRKRWYSFFAYGRLDSKYLVWFYDRHFFTYEYGLAELAELPGLELVAEREDGLILRGNSAAFPREFSELIAGIEPVIDSRYTVRHVDDWLVYDTTQLENEYDVFRVGNVLTYSREAGCGSAAEPEPRFFLHVYAVDEYDLAPHRRRYGFDNLNFHLHERGMEHARGCTVPIDLPEYDVERIVTGQFYKHPGPEGPRYEQIWSAEAAGNQSRVRTTCMGTRYSGPGFFLHVYPVHERDLDPGRERFGFNKQHSGFRKDGFSVDGRCVWWISLPGYGIRLIRTGQLEPGRVVWAGEFSPAGS